MHTAKVLVKERQERMAGQGQSLGPIVSNHDPDKQHLVGVAQFLKYEPDGKLLVAISTDAAATADACRAAFSPAAASCCFAASRDGGQSGDGLA